MKGFIIYLILVGIPVAGVIGVLRVGQRITPPPYVGGTWAVTMRPDSSCHAAAGTTTDSVTMVVSQSGPHVAVAFDGVALPRLTGRAYGRYLRATGSPDKIELHAAMKRGEDRMRGILIGVPCAGARKTMLRGTRVAAPGAVAGH